jgi:Zn-dependent protease
MNNVTLMGILAALATTMIPLILSIAVHEWAHVAMARFLGDRTGEERGRLTLDPLAHIDPLWTVALPAISVIQQVLAGSTFPVPLIAAGKPAPYTPVRLDRRFGGKRITMRTAEMWVALAGPLSNLAIAVLMTIVLGVMLRMGASLANGMSPAVLFFQVITMNVGLMLFNLVPIPPLDGSKVMHALLPTEAARRYAEFAEKFSMVLLVALFVFGRHLLGPLNHLITTNLVRVVVWMSHVGT